ncbi:MAG: 2-oxo-4-hydroxy-4-carboxy-5-ureidoimidazoline decarboxylase [Robiginitomaculum sp.]|nr:2-oxo-4-hydroxy-4-carboxy-5-ureidoimidazoline decarboxylase [Robiginitomaculum sp.]
MTKGEFTAAFGGAYEHSPWAAERAYAPDLKSPCRVIPAMAKVVDTASAGEKDALIKAHPDLAGKLALSGGLTASSTKEQAGAGLDQCSPRELEKFQKYNAAYWEKFGFPFIVAVKGMSRKDILKAFKTRLKNTEVQERQTALAQIHKIAAIRIEDWFQNENT